MAALFRNKKTGAVLLAHVTGFKVGKRPGNARTVSPADLVNQFEPISNKALRMVRLATEAVDLANGNSTWNGKLQEENKRQERFDLSK